MCFAILLTVLGPVVIAGLEKMNITEFLELITHVAVAFMFQFILEFGISYRLWTLPRLLCVQARC